MDLLWMILLVFLVCAEAQNVTEVKVELGQNISLNCSWNNSDTYWFTEINSQVRGSIGRSFTNDPSGSQYYVYTFRPKYSAFGNILLITNITAEDCRLYFCGRRINGSVQFVDTFSLVSDVPTTSPTNTTVGNDSSILLNELIKYSSFALNVFFLVLIGLVCLKKKKKKKDCTCQINEPPPVYDSPETVEPRQYEEIQLSPYRPPAAPPESIYYKAQLPRSTHPGR
ncbi:uncharacterized protein [Channa argus]|uniref:uncharacterized protein isoform X1 n=1 Tax=Channa argus TaxID=215402 RepID=UPI002948B00C|nr:hypothetical protein Q8A73_004018 [Channa argus]